VFVHPHLIFRFLCGPFRIKEKEAISSSQNFLFYLFVVYLTTLLKSRAIERGIVGKIEKFVERSGRSLLKATEIQNGHLWFCIPQSVKERDEPLFQSGVM
jgi:hypothetical protein